MGSKFLHKDLSEKMSISNNSCEVNYEYLQDIMHAVVITQQFGIILLFSVRQIFTIKHFVK